MKKAYQIIIIEDLVDVASALKQVLKLGKRGYKYVTEAVTGQDVEVYVVSNYKMTTDQACDIVAEYGS